MQHFPEAKVILTVRDPESWYRSTRETVYEAARSVPAWLERIPRVRMIVRLLDGSVWDGVFHGRFEDAETSKKIFADHTEDVKRSVPPGRLLVYSVREGWGPLCEFLGVAVPEKMPFPHENERAQVRRTVRALKLTAVLPYALGAALLVWVGISLA